MSAPTSDTLTPEQQSIALQKLRDLDQKTRRQVNVTEYVRGIKQSMLFQPGFTLNDTLSAAPVSVSLLASLLKASSIRDAEQITIIAPQGGFKTFRSGDESASMRACLIQCLDAGVKALANAGNFFGAIASESRPVKETINRIVMTLGDPESATRELAPTFSTLARIAERCQSHAKRMDTPFQEWLDMLCEVHMCIVQASDSASEKRAANQLHLAAAQTKVVSAEEARKLASDSISTLKSSLNLANGVYKKAADEFPSDWDFVAQQFVSDLSDSFTNAFNLAIPALIENYSVAAKIDKGVNIFSGDNGGARGGSVGDGKQDNSIIPAATQAPLPIPSAVLPFPNDPAYGVIGPIRGFVTTVQSIITGGADKGVDWDLLQSTDPSKQNSGIGVIASLLENAESLFKASSNPPSQRLLAVFCDVRKVTDALKNAIAANKSNGIPLPMAGSTEVKAWQLNVSNAAVQAIALDVDSKLISTAKSVPLLNPTQLNSSPTDKKGSFKQQVIDAATIKLATTAKVMEVSTENYQKASERLVDVQSKIGDIQAQLASLQASNMNLDTIKAILVKCIEITVQLKSQISRFVSFFSAVGTVVEYFTQNQVGQLITYLRDRTGGPELSILNFSYTDFQRQIIFGFSFSIRAYFELFQDLARMYDEVHKRYTLQGLEMVNSLSAEYSSSMGYPEAQKRLEARASEVARFTSQAHEEMKRFLHQPQNENSENLNQNAQAAAADRDFMPVRPAATFAKAIDASADSAKQAATKGIKESGAYVSRQFGSTSSFVDESS